MEHTEHIEHTDAPKDMKSKIWRTFWILLAFTVIDIVLYFMLLTTHSMWKNAIFIVLGVVKAYYIVGIFMHMTFERKTLKYTIILPMIFVIFFIALMIIEGNFTLSVR
ncbi:MAG: cytochrome C oxidase subunit IV family protein [Bacteroidota bacterium]|nr:cytochrome C oxidase subunit IV family protein [Bacteroidota bacterium]